MEYQGPERRREPRHPVGTGVVLKRKTDGKVVRGTTLDASTGGVLMQISSEDRLEMGDEVFCQFDVIQHSSIPLPAWAVGRVVRTDTSKVAITLYAANPEALSSMLAVPLSEPRP